MARTPKKQPTLLTKRLRLRPFRGSDLPAMHQLYGDADNLRYWSVEASPNLAHTRKSLRWHLAYRPQHYVMWAIEERAARKGDGRGAIGMINYHRRDLREKRVDVGWLMLPQHQGKGYAAEAGRALLRFTDTQEAIEFQAGDGRLHAEAADIKGKGPKVDATSATWLGLMAGTLKPWLAFTRGMVIARAGLTELRWLQQVAERLQKAYEH